MGDKLPDGLSSFKSVLEKEMPDIVHFHEIAGSNGISFHHVQLTKSMGFKTIMTFHLASNTCLTGNMLYKEKSLCDGKIDVKKCTSCYLFSKTGLLGSSFLTLVSDRFYKSRIDATQWNNRLGTVLGTSYIVDKKRSRFNKLSKNCDQLIVLTNWYKNVLLLNGVPVSKISHIPQALPVISINSTSIISRPIESQTIRLVFAGRISHFKGLHILISALLKLPVDQISLDIYGYPTNTSYEKRLRRLTINNSNVIWKGGLPAGQMSSVMKAYDALCLCSTFSEMAPLVIQEAFAAGIPVIASDVPGNAEMIQNGKNGLLFKFKDEESLYSILHSCITDKSLLSSLKTNVKSPESFNKVASSHLLLYNKLIGN
jgi:glycosyltransferase involved in cell wall biosynthesis